MLNVRTFKTALLSSEEVILKRTTWMIVQGCAMGIVSYSCVQPLLDELAKGCNSAEFLPNYQELVVSFGDSSDVIQRSNPLPSAF